MKRIIFIGILALNSLAFADVDPVKLANSLSRIEENRAKKGSHEVEVLGHKFWTHSNVFSPEFFASTAITNRHFPFKPNERFLDIGSGVGVTSVIAAKLHQNKVVALDINPDAVATTQKNIELHGLEGQVDVRLSDVFSAIAAHEAFDTIFWDLPYVRSDEDANLDLLQRAVSDPGYAHIKRFFSEVRWHLKPHGRAIIGFGSLGDRAFLDEIAQANGFHLVEIASEAHPYRGGISYSLLELRSAKCNFARMSAGMQG